MFTKWDWSPSSSLNSQALLLSLPCSVFSKSSVFHLVELKSSAQSCKVTRGLLSSSSYSCCEHFCTGGLSCGYWNINHEYRWAASSWLSKWKWTDGDGYFHSPYWLYRGDLPATKEEGKADRKVLDGRSARGGILWQSERDAGLRDPLSQGCKNTKEEEAEEDSQWRSQCEKVSVLFCQFVLFFNPLSSSLHFDSLGHYTSVTDFSAVHWFMYAKMQGLLGNL